MISLIFKIEDDKVKYYEVFFRLKKFWILKWCWVCLSFGKYGNFWSFKMKFLCLESFKEGYWFWKKVKSFGNMEFGIELNWLLEIMREIKGF